MSVWLLGLIGTIPFVLLFSGLILFKIPSYITSIAVLFVSILLGLFVWNLKLEKMGYAALEGLIIALVPIVWVIFAAVFTYLISVKTGAMDVIKEFLLTVTPDLNIQAVLIAFCLGGFLESVAGFGTAVAIPTAMLITLGFQPVKAAVISLVANSVPVAFGALGIPVIILAEITNFDISIITRYVAMQLIPFAIMIPMVLLFIANGSLKGIKKSIFDVILIGFIFTLVQTLVAFFIGPELVAVLGSIVSLFVYIVYKKITQKNGQSANYLMLLKSIINYCILLFFIIITRVFLSGILAKQPFSILFTLGENEISIPYITTPGTLLFISAIIGGIIQGIKINQIWSIIVTTLDKIKFSIITIVCIVILAKIMGKAGMISSLAICIAAISGGFYPFISPILGAIGTFITGSDTSSNILLGELQKQTAIQINVNPEWITAANTSGATAGKMISPQSISVAASTVGIASEESKIIKKTIIYCFGYVLILGLYIFITTSVFFSNPV